MTVPEETSPVFAANRAIGNVTFEVRQTGGVTRRGNLHESGSLRVRFPSPEARGLSAVLVNTAGGIAGGDRFDIDIAAGEGTQLTVTTAAAEKVYRSHGPDAHLRIRLQVDAGAALTWLPQETILFDQAQMSRRFDIDLADTASMVLCETIVFGRAAMGERMRHGRLIDCWRLRRGGKLMFAETVRLDGDISGMLSRSAVACGGVAIGTALIVPGDEMVVERIRARAKSFGSEVGVSAWNGFAMVRVCAQDAARLRADMIAALGALDGVVLPRLWLN
jgi:urease accessory protein